MMMNEILVKTAAKTVGYIVIQMLTPANVRDYGKRLFDLVEEFVTDSTTPIDDAVVLPIISALRKGLGL